MYAQKGNQKIKNLVLPSVSEDLRDAHSQPDSTSLLESDLATSSQVEAVHPRDCHVYKMCAGLFCSTLGSSKDVFGTPNVC